jgi:uncharacterized protein YbaR (Trm112 family)
MKKALMDILACPVCKGDLELRIDEEDAQGDVVSGSLYCGHCDERYPIEEGIPNLLPPAPRQRTE